MHINLDNMKSTKTTDENYMKITKTIHENSTNNTQKSQKDKSSKLPGGSLTEHLATSLQI